MAEVPERVRADGTIETPLESRHACLARSRAADGIDAVAIVFMHAYAYPAHEQAAAKLAREMGFAQVSVSHEVRPLVKFVGRGDTTVVDAYLSPLLRRYVDRIAYDVSKVLLSCSCPRGANGTSVQGQRRDFPARLVA